MTLGYAALAYAGLTLLLFRGLLPVIGTSLYPDLGDPLLNTAILHWNAIHLPLTETWWNFPAFVPAAGATTYTEHLLGTYLVASPVVWLTGNAVLAYNVVLLTSFLLNAVTMHALARHLTGSSLAAFAGGLAFAFAPYHAVQLSHLQTLMAFGMPLTLLGLHQWFDRRQRRGLVLIGGGWLITAASNAYLMVFFPILLALWFTWFGTRRPWRPLAVAVAALAVATLPLVPVLAGYAARHRAIGLARSYSEIRLYSADILGLTGTSSRSAVWGTVLPDTYGEGSLFPGLTILLLAMVALIAAASRRAADPGARNWMSPAFAAAGGLLAVAALVRSAASRYRVVTFAAVAALLAVLFSLRFRAGWRQRDPVLFYAAAALVLWLVALGPEPTWNGARALTYGPYRMLVDLPGGQSLRVPARAWLVAALCLSVLAAFGAAAIVARVGRHRRRRQIVIAGLLTGALVAEGWFRDAPLAAPAARDFVALPEGSQILHLPADDILVNTRAQYLAVVEGHRTLNGYSGYIPPHYARLERLLKDLRADALNPYREQEDLYVVIWGEPDAARTRWLVSHAGAERVSGTPAWVAYRLPRLNPARLPAVS